MPDEKRIGVLIASLLPPLDHDAAVGILDSLIRQLSATGTQKKPDDAFTLAEKLQQITHLLHSVPEGRISTGLGEGLADAEKNHLVPAREALKSLKQTLEEIRVLNARRTPLPAALASKASRLSDTYMYALEEMVVFKNAVDTALEDTSEQLSDAVTHKDRNRLPDTIVREYETLQAGLTAINDKLQAHYEAFSAGIAMEHDRLTHFFTTLEKAASPHSARNGSTAQRQV